MVLIKAKRLPPRLPRPQGGPNTPKEVPPSSPASAGPFIFRASEAPVSGLPSTARKKLAARLGAWAEIRACALNRSPTPSLADRDRRRGSAPAPKLPHRAARKRGTSSERNCACFAFRLASGSPPGELHWIMLAAPRRLRSPPQEDRRCAQACAAKGVSSLLPAERLFPAAHCGYPSASAGVVQW